MTQLIDPYGGKLIDLVAHDDEREELVEQASRLPSVQLSERGVCDLELLATGGFSPLDRFMGREDYERVVVEMRLADDTVFPIPITLPVDNGESLALDKWIAVRDPRNDLLALMRIDEIYEWAKQAYAREVLGTDDPRHPLATEMQHWGRNNISGQLRVLSLPKHPDFADLRQTPSQTRYALSKLSNPDIVAFQTRNPIHRAHEEITKRAMDKINGTLLIHPAVGMTKPGDIDYFTRVRSYRALVDKYYDATHTFLALLPLAMRMAGPREAVWHAIIRRNHGANHFIVGRDHASPGKNSNGQEFYPADAAQKLAIKMSDDIGVKIITFGEMAYLPDEDLYEETARIAKDTKVFSLSGTQIRERYLGKAGKMPDWFTRPETAAILNESFPPPDKQGFCIWFTGLSGSGKSVTAEHLAILLNEQGRRVTILDGDVVRTHLSKGLGFSKEDRDTNILRIGFVASEIVRHNGVVISAAVSPYREARNEVRQMVGTNFVEVFVNTPLELCEQRDTKGMYAKARRGDIKDFTGIDDPYEEPETAEVILDTVSSSIGDNADKIIQYLAVRGFIAAPRSE